MPWLRPTCDLACSPSRMLCAIAASLLPLLVTAGSYASSPRFTPTVIYASGGMAQYTATADVNGDGKQDVFASNLNGVVSLLLGNGNGSLQASKTIASLGAGSYPILTADFNGDGKPDLAILQPAKTRVLIYLGRGDGTFQPFKQFYVGEAPRFMAVGDVNRDNHLDLIVSASIPSKSNPGAVGFTILLGDGTGTFHAPVMVTAKNGSAGGVIAVGDLNRDGDLDVVTCGQAGQSEVFLGNGNGTFREQVPFDDGASEGGESQLLLADLHGTGKLDLVVGYFGFEGFPGSVILFSGNGDGTFSPNTSIAPGFLPIWLGAADMNGDGKLDVVVGNGFSNSVSVLLNQGSGNFTFSQNNYATDYLINDQLNETPTPGLLSIADLNGDGKPDVTLAGREGVNVLMNLGGGVLYAPGSVEVGQLTGPILATDFNADGHNDLAITTDGFLGADVGQVNVLFGNGKGNFSAPNFYLLEGIEFGPLAGGSFNGNGKPGIAAYGLGDGIDQIYNTGNGAFVNGPTVDIPNQPPYFCAGDFNHDGYSDLAVLDGNEVDVYMNKHDGTYSGPVTFKVGVNPLFIVARDINNDGKVDLVSANHDSNDVSVLLGNGNGTFQLAKSYAAGTHPNIVTTGDFNGDGKIDLAIGGNQATILLGHGDGTFGSPSTFAAHGPVTFLAQIPSRGNGIEDLLALSTDFTGNTLPANIYLLSGKGDGTFAAPVAYGGGANPYWLAIADFNDDGAMDAIVSTWDASSFTLLLNHGGTRIALKSSAITIKVGQSVSFTATLSASVPGSGQPTGTVSFRDGSKTIGTATLASGKALFSTTHLAAGTHTITASYGGDGSFNSHVSGSVTVKVSP
jgi:Bacterial Ig-like domain (group 3)/FG-GAP-like repeat